MLLIPYGKEKNILLVEFLRTFLRCLLHISQIFPFTPYYYYFSAVAAAAATEVRRVRVRGVK